MLALVDFSASLPILILALAVLASFGNSLARAPWILLAPAFTIVTATLAVSLVGDWLRDRPDPTLR